MNISIIVPAYNEEKRISLFLKSLLDYSKKHFKDYEIIIVNDGSTDRTEDVVSGILRNDRNAKIVSYRKNMGKGYAVKTGILESKGKYVVFIDADGSIAPDQIPLLLDKLKKYDVVVGSRRMLESDVKASWFRVFIGTFFNYYVNLLFRIDVWDNLCGFKGFRRAAAMDLFKNLIEKRWVFDVEIFYKIKKKRYSLYELPIEWVHKEGTKISMIDPVKMAFRLVVLRIKLI